MIYLFPITAINRDGSTELLYSIAAVLEFVKGKYVGQEWVRDDLPLWFRPTRDPVENQWILRDDRGRPVDYREFIPARGDWKSRRRKIRKDHTFRDGPVSFGWNFRGCTKFRRLKKKNGGIRAHRVLPDILDKEFKGRKLNVRYFD